MNFALKSGFKLSFSLAKKEGEGFKAPHTDYLSSSSTTAFTSEKSL